MSFPFIPNTTLEWVLFAWVFWYLYVLVMGFYRAHLNKRLSKTVFALALPAIVVGFVVDVFANFTLAWTVFFDMPKELLVTSRLQRYLAQGEGWRYKLAKVICDNLLDPFDPKGKHC